MTATSDPTSYNIKRSTTSGGPYTTLATQSNTNYTDANVTDGNFYYYVVTAVRDGAESSPTAEVTAVPTVSGVTIQSASVGNGHVDLAWTVSHNASGYVIKRATTSGGPYTNIPLYGNNSFYYSDTGLTNGCTYYYRVTALNPAGNGGGTDSNEVSATPQAPPVPAAPSNLSAMAGNGQVWLSWGSTVSGQYASYTVERSTTTGTGYAVIASNVQNTSYKDMSAANNTTYFYVVVPVNDGVVGSVSNEVSATPQDFAADFGFEAIGLSFGEGGINDLTQVATTHFDFGNCANTPNAIEHASLWDPQSDYQQDLGTFSPTIATDSYGTGINNLTQEVGWAQDSSYNFHAFLWDPINGMQNIGDFYPSGISDGGEISGSVYTSAGPLAVITNGGGSLSNLGTLVPDPNNTGQYLGSSIATSVNNGGLIAGASAVNTGDINNLASHAFLHSGFNPLGSSDDLGTLGGSSSSAVHVNNFGQAAGWSTTSDGFTHACLFDGGIQDLGTLGGSNSFAYGINDLGQIVGQSQTADGSTHAFLWQNGSMLDLNSLLPAYSLWDALDDAWAINNVGEIVGSGSNTGYERMFLMKHGTPQTTDLRALPTYQRPATLAISSNWGNGKDWTMTATVSDNDGLVLNDVKLGNRYMAQEMSVPYYTLETTGLEDAQGNYVPVRGELTPDSNATQARCRLVKFDVSQPGANPLVVQATYVIDNISRSGANSWLSIVQRYEFYQETSNCEPSQYAPIVAHLAPLQASAFKPIVQYAFHGSQGEALTKINIPQRLHFVDDNETTNTAAFYQDANSIPGVAVGGIFKGQRAFSVIAYKSTPVTETSFYAIQNGQDKGVFDNYHQTYNNEIDDPTTNPAGPGCPECIHVHWRWSALAGAPVPQPLNLINTAPVLTDPYLYGSGKPRIPFGSNQDVEVALVKYTPGEEHPTDFHTLVNGESLAGQGLVFWYSGTGYLSQDRFFTHGGFFSADGDQMDTADVKITQDPVTQTTISNGDTVQFTYHITNVGAQPARNPLVVDVLPQGLNLVSASSNGDNTVSLIQNPDDTLDCLIGEELDPGDEVTITVVAQATASGPQLNITGVADSDSYDDPDTSDKQVSQTITVQ